MSPAYRLPSLWRELHHADSRSRASRKAFETSFGDSALYGKVEVVPFSGATRGLGAPNSVDLAFTARNIHNWMGAPGRVDAVFSDLYAVIKPGGYLGVKEHRSDPQPMKPGASDGYVSEAYVIEAATKAGFVLDARSEINANPKDTKDHPFGVWHLEGPSGEENVKVTGPLSSNHGEVVHQWCLDGRGILLRSWWDVHDSLADGRLVQVLPEYQQQADIWAVHAAPLASSARVRVAVEFFRQYFAERYTLPES